MHDPPAAAGKEGRHGQHVATCTADQDPDAHRLPTPVVLLLLLPLCAAWWAAAHLAAWLITFTIMPSVLLAHRLYWACPFIPHIFKQMGPVRGWAARIGFEASYCINVLTRVLTLPMRRDLPTFYIIGFPKCGTTSLAAHLKRHPGISGPAGLPFHEALEKETHFFEGVLGRGAAYGATLYRSFFPTVMHRWWAERVRGVRKWMCFDGCPVHACLPYVARRIAHVTPEAKIIAVVRDPVAAVFSAEVMLTDMGAPLQWRSLSQPLAKQDERFTPPSKEEVALWQRAAELDVTAPLPPDLPSALYFTIGGLLRGGQFADLLQPYLDAFPPQNVMVVTFEDLRDHTEAVVQDVLRFVGADVECYAYTAQAPAMQNQYAGREVHPTVAAKLRALFQPSILRLQERLQRDLKWGDRPLSGA